MGNWRTVRIIGKVAQSDVKGLKEACTPSETHENYHCLSINVGLYGLGDWVDEYMDVGGNLAERDYDVPDVAGTLGELVKVAPSMDLKVHCGSDYEDTKCIATITVRDNKVEIGEPEVEFVKGASKDEVTGRLYNAISPQIICRI